MLDKRLKVVHILEGFSGGAGTYICTVLPQLVREGFDITLIVSLNRSCPDAPARISQLRADGVAVYVIPMSRQIDFLKDVRSFAAILRMLSANDFDIVHTHCSKAGALGRIAGFLAGKNVRLHSPHCFAFVRCDGRLRKTLYFILEKALGKLTTRLVTVSRSEAAIAVRCGIVPRCKCARVRNGLSNGQSLSNTAFRPESSIMKDSLGIDGDTRVVSTACRLVAYKGIFKFLAAVLICNAPDVVFLIAGDGELRGQAERFIMENKLNKKVRLLGHVSNIESLYALSDVVVLCSDAEAQPYLLLEAMRAKRPIVATSVIGNKELIAHNRTGLLVPPTAAGIAGAIDELLADEHKRRTYAQNAYDHFCRRHTLEKQISELTRVYKSCM